MLRYIIVCAVIFNASARAQITPPTMYCHNVVESCVCDAEANTVSIHCPQQYAMMLELSDIATNLYMSYYTQFDLTYLPRFEIPVVAKLQIDAYQYWPSNTFLTDILVAMGIDSVESVEFQDHISDTDEAPSLVTDSNSGSNITRWLFSSVPALTNFRFNSCVKELQESIFQSFDSLTTLELRLSLFRLPDRLLSTVRRTLRTLIIENPNMVIFHAPMLSGLQELRNITIQLKNAKKGNQLQPHLFSSLRKLEEIYLVRATSEWDAFMFDRSFNLRRIQITGNDLLSTLPALLFRDQKLLITLDLHNNGLNQLPKILFTSLGRLEHLDLSSNKLTTLSSELFAPLGSLREVNLNNNPLTALNPDTFSEVRSLNLVDMCGTQSYGTKLSMKYEALVCTNSEICQYKAEYWQCASHCVCWIERQTLELLVSCQDSQLTELPELPATTLVNTVLKASNNSLTILPDGNTPGYANVTKLFLADNQLTSLDNPTLLPVNLTFLDVRRNQISAFSEEFITYLLENTTMSMALSGNPLRCDCDALFLLGFVRSQPQRVPDISDLECASGATKHNKMFHQLDISDICPSYLLLICFIVGGITVFLCLLSIVYLVYQQEVKIWLYNHNLCLWWVSEEELDKDKTYDAFISYSHKDEELIDKLLDKLENGPHAFRLCLHGRDWMVGDCIPEQIIRTVADSKRIIIILSQHFVDSIWARMEFRIAYQATLQDKRKRIIIILYNELEHCNGIDSELRAYLKLNTYLKWGDPLFWSKLRYAMPHNRRVLKGQKKHAGPLI